MMLVDSVVEDGGLGDCAITMTEGIQSGSRPLMLSPIV